MKPQVKCRLFFLLDSYLIEINQVKKYCNNSHLGKNEISIFNQQIFYKLITILVQIIQIFIRLSFFSKFHIHIFFGDAFLLDKGQKERTYFCNYGNKAKM